MATTISIPRRTLRLTSATFCILHRRTLATTSKCASQFNRSDFSGQGFTGSYEAGLPTTGPLADASIYGVPRITPRMLKQHLDQFVVGQERAKRVLSVAVYNHYQRIQELQRRDEEEEELLQQRLRREMGERSGERHPVEDEFPGQQPTIPIQPPQPVVPTSRLGQAPLIDSSPLAIEKSNIMMLGPSGVGKTLMAKTLARVLEVPFSMSDCTPFTQAGYIGEDAEVCVQRLLAAANYDVARAERGIICLDEVDKIATVKVAHGKDVSGEGVQQALLKIVEGTTLQIQAKQERGGGRIPGGSGMNQNMNIPGGPGGLGGGPGGGAGAGGAGIGPTTGKGEVYNVRTDNILFIFTGAFIGLQKIIMDRIAHGSIGFEQPVRAANADSSQTTFRGEKEVLKKYLPFFDANESNQSSSQNYNPLDLVEPGDLQKYGLIPELVGRVPVATALSPLDEESLVRVLTEPRNCLMKQYQQLFQLSGIELKFTSGALREVAKAAIGMGTGARGLRTVMERLLADAMFEAPGSSIKFILVNQAAAQKKEALIYLARGQQFKFHSLIASEEEEWERIHGKASTQESDSHYSTFEQYREKGRAAGLL
ncbi:P-loop containing nucleoside triphosphate hydrolase protein [Xylona heveae TC161]|uniref:p-loop containing nucleoside triphosphate hydrolase protein n=1 Tax=Xylona heveae (strain CBS 132557 / TC161) TaxID=1328760 RepID=A0A165AJW7_XYLHT|nr:P-loop containing nucleoside triphosphate hydrolase protein [Xylona heveae TC161]KZF20602.1 P-loop containing nucleoside triphosphate hydrolase protein [Xylona heveae TC161]